MHTRSFCQNCETYRFKDASEPLCGHCRHAVEVGATIGVKPEFRREAASGHDTQIDVIGQPVTARRTRLELVLLGLDRPEVA